MYDLISFLRLDFINFLPPYFRVFDFRVGDAGVLPSENLQCRKSAQISARDALFAAAPYQLHCSA